MAIDQRDVSSTLRFMDDRALQRYAAMHKNDPYIFPLAFQESQNRQKMRMSQQSAQGMQPQPKVADQALAQMMPQPMPEDQGIGALAAPNMQTMADGGIAGYEGYDEGPSDFGQGPVMMMAEGGVARYRTGGTIQSRYQQESQEMVSGNRVQYSPDVAAYAAQIANEARAERQAGEQEFLKQEQQRMLRGPNADFAPLAAPAAPNSPVSFKGTMPEPGYTYRGMENDPRLDTPRTIPKMDPKVDTERKDTVRKAPVAAAPVVAATATEKEPTGIDALAQQFLRPTELAIGEQRNARVGLASRLEKEATDEAEETKKRIKERGDVFKGKEDRLAAREKGIEGMGDKYLGLALLQAGAAMMSTPGNIGTVLGKGIQVGSERYIAGIDKINAAKDKFADARDRLEDLRLNRDDMNEKEIRAADRGIRTARIQGQQLLLDGATNDLKISNDNQKAIFGVAASALEKDKDIKSREKIAAIGENRADARAAAGNRNPQLEMLQALQADPKLMTAYRTMQGKNEDVMGQYNDFLKANPTLALDQKAAFTQFLMTKSAFQQLGNPTVTDKPTGPVRN